MTTLTIEDYEASLDDRQRADVERGRWVAQHYQKGMLVEGRPIGMAEAKQMEAFRRDQAARKAIETGCCGDPSDLRKHGYCVNAGMDCPLMLEANRLNFKMFGKD